MFKISRAYLAHTGYRLAWYDGLLLDFRDVQSNAPTNTIYNLVNQGGKTTFLSLIFSCVRTKKDEFLQTLANPGQRFEDYFDKDGTPGLIAIEWTSVGSDGQVRSMITGQIVVMARPGGEAERWFFLISDTAKLAMESLPGPNLGQAELLNRDAVIQWLHQSRANLGEQAFYYTQTQSEWARALNSTGLDVGLIGRQVDFNRREGAMDESFLSFKDEQEFLRRFLTMTMNSENSDRVYQAVAVHSKNIASRKPLQEALGQLERLQTHLEPFALAATEVALAQRSQDLAQEALSSAVATLQVRAQAALIQEKTSEATAMAQAMLAVAGAEARVCAIKDLEVAQDEQYTRALAQCKSQVFGADEGLKSLHIRRREVDAARTMRRHEAHKFAFKELSVAIDALSGDIAPLRIAYGTAAAQFFSALRSQRAAVLRKKQLGAETEKQARQDIRNDKDALKTLSQRRGDNLGKIIGIEHALEAGYRQHQALVSGGTFKADEACESAVLRLEQALSSTQGTLRELEAQQIQGEVLLGELNGQASQLRSDEVRCQTNGDQAAASLAAAQTSRAALSAHPVLCAAIQADQVDPDSPVLPGLLARHQQAIQQEVTQCEIAVAKRKEDADSLQQTGLCGRNQDVLRIVDFLLANGISNARSYAQYISDVVPNADAASQLVQSDPARFLGVVVPGPAELELARSLTGYPLIASPVIVSVAATVPELDAPSTRLNVFVVGSRDHRLFNLNAAKSFAFEVTSQLKTQLELRDAARQALAETLKIKVTLQTYLEQSGPEKMAVYQDLVDRAEKALSVLKAQRLRIQLDTTNQSARNTAIKLELKEVGESLTAAHQSLRQAQSFRLLHESQAPGLGAQRLLHLGEKADIAAEAAELESSLEGSELTLRQTLQELDALTAEEQSVFREIGSITGRNESWQPAPGSPALDVATSRLIFKTAALALSAKETGESAALQARKALCEESLAAVQQEYVVKSKDLVAEHIASLRKADLDAVDLAAAQAIPAAEKLKDFHVGARAVAQTTLANWRASRQYAAYHNEAFAILSTSELSSLREQLDTAVFAATQTVQTASEQQRTAQLAAKGHRKDAHEFSAASTTLKAYEAGTALVRTDTFLTASFALEEANTLREEAQDSEKAVKRLRAQAFAEFELIRALAAEPTFSKVDLDLALTLQRNTLSEAMEDHARLGQAVAERMACINSDLTSMDADFDRAMDALLQLVDDSLSLLKRATQGIKLPDNVPRVAGCSVMKISPKVFATTRDERLELLKPEMLALSAENRLPGSGPELAMHAIMRLAPDRRLGLKLLKVVDDEQEQYVAVERMSKSGAESVSMAMLLYFVIAKLRSEELHGRQASAGVLILDNPFSKATARPVWEIIVGLAEAMGLQLILATGIKEYETLSVFKRFIRVAKVSRNSETGRTHLGFADFALKTGTPPQIPQPALGGAGR